MKKNKLFITTLFCLIFTLVLNSVTFATTYKYWPYGYHFSNVDLRFVGLTGKYYTGSLNAINSWNNCGQTKRSVTASSSSPNTVSKIYDNFSYWGLYKYLEANYALYAPKREYSTTKFLIYFNTKYLIDDSSLTDAKVQAVLCHEIGHALGLDHNDDPIDPGTTIMRSTNAACLYYKVPQTYDINAVNGGWPNY